MTLKVRILLFSTFDSKTTERPKILAVFIVLWPYLLVVTKLRLLQKSKIGHTTGTGMDPWVIEREQCSLTWIAGDSNSHVESLSFNFQCTSEGKSKAHKCQIENSLKVR